MPSIRLCRWCRDISKPGVVFQHFAQQWPKEIFTRIAFQPRKLLPILCKDKGRCENHASCICHAFRCALTNICTQKRRKLPFCDLWIGWTNFGVPSFAVNAAHLIDHNQLRFSPNLVRKAKQGGRNKGQSQGFETFHDTPNEVLMKKHLI